MNQYILFYLFLLKDTYVITGESCIIYENLLEKAVQMVKLKLKINLLQIAWKWVILVLFLANFSDSEGEPPSGSPLNVQRSALRCTWVKFYKIFTIWLRSIYLQRTHCSVDYCVELILVDETLCKKLLSFLS